MADNEIKKITEILSSKLSGMNDIAAAYLFGSAVNGRFKAKSDIDLALLFSDYNKDTFDRLAIMSSLSADTGRDVDLVVLNEASPLLFHEIVSTGRIILEKNPQYRIQREVKNRKLYDDYRHIHRIYMQGMRKKYG